MDFNAVNTPDQDWTDRATINVEEMAHVLGIGRSAAYEAVRTGQVPSLRIGRRVLVPVRGLLALLEGVTTDGGPAGT